MTGFKWKHLQHCKIPEVIASRTSLSNFLVRFFEPFVFRKETQSCLTSPLSVSLAPRKKLLLHCSAYSSISVYHFSQSSICLLGLLGYPPAHFTKLFHIAAYSSSPHLTSKAPLVLLCSTAYCLSQESKKQEKCEGMIQGKRENWLSKFTLQWVLMQNTVWEIYHLLISVHDRGDSRPTGQPAQMGRGVSIVYRLIQPSSLTNGAGDPLGKGKG